MIVSLGCKKEPPLQFRSTAKRLSQRRSRQAALLVAVLVCLLIASAFVVGFAKTVVEQLHQDRMRTRARQAKWLVESGIERAVASLRKSPEYGGEIWTVSADDLVGTDSARVEILVSTNENAGGHSIEVIADYPSNRTHRQRRRKQIVIEVIPRGEN